jgi:hypothetical protein
MGHGRRQIELVWWLGLLGALVATLVVLKEVALVLRALRDIRELAGLTREAAEGIARNVEPTKGLGALGGPVGSLDEGTRKLADVAARIEQQLDALAPSTAGKTGTTEG